jgi:hypothetical protein
MRGLAVLQWVGLLAGAALWGFAHIVGYGVTEADCSPVGARWSLNFDRWQWLTNGISALLVLGGLAAAALVVLGTGSSSYEAAPPVGRMRFFAIAALIANLLFLAMIVLYLVGTVANTPCRQA